MEEQQPSTNDPVEPSPDVASPAEEPILDNPPPSTPSEYVKEEVAAVTMPLTPAEAPLSQEAHDHSLGGQPSAQQPWRTLTRRQVLTGAGIVVGVAAIGTGTTLALISGSPSNSSSSSPLSTISSATGTPGTVGPPPAQTPVSEDTLQAWRTKRLTIQPSQRFQHQRGTAIVPLGVVESTYPNPYNLYTIHLQGYILGGDLVARTQFFLYLGLESLDGSQFVAKVRVGPVD